MCQRNEQVTEMTDLYPEQFEELVEAALQVDPSGLSGKHKDSGRDALKVREVLVSKGFSETEINAWWNKRNPCLDGQTPNMVWLRDETPSESLVRLILSAAEAAAQTGDNPVEVHWIGGIPSPFGRSPRLSVGCVNQILPKNPQPQAQAGDKTQAHVDVCNDAVVAPSPSYGDGTPVTAR
jgi:hypothetical protein